MDNNAQFLQDNPDQVDDYTGVYSDFVGYTYDCSSTSFLLDSCSTVNLIVNKDLCHGIHKANTTMHIQCTTRVATTNLQGCLGDFPEPVWYIPQRVTNILSFYIVQKYYQIHCNTQKHSTFFVMKPADVTGIIFHPTGKDLYALANLLDGLAFFGVRGVHTPALDFIHISTVDNCKREYTKHEYWDAPLAQKILHESCRTHLNKSKG